MNSPPENTPGEPRRSFFTHALAAIAGIGAILVPLATGIVVLFDPVLRKQSHGKWMKVTSLDAVPADGEPHRFAVVDEAPVDKWNLYEPQPVGSVYLTRTTSSAPPVAHSAICPHLGCTVDYHPAQDQFRCPCHNAIFASNGNQVQESTVSPRDLDELAVEVREGDVWVDYRKFKVGVEEKVEV